MIHTFACEHTTNYVSGLIKENENIQMEDFTDGHSHHKNKKINNDNNDYLKNDLEKYYQIMKNN